MANPSKSLLFPLLLVLYEIATYLSNDMYLPALPSMMQDLGINMQQAQLTLTMWFMGAASAPLVMGVISDRYGRRPVLLLGGLIYILATVLCAITANLSVLLSARVIQGCMIASVMVSGYACIHELYERNEAIRLLALMGSITVLAPAFGPLLGSMVLLVANWRWIFWVIAIWATLAILLLAKWMPETQSPEKRHPIHWATLFKQYGRIITNKHFMRFVFVLGFIFAGFIVWITAGPLLVIQTFHYSASQFGIIQAGIFIVYIVANRCVKYLLEWLGVRYLIRLGLVVALCGGLLMLVFAINSPKNLYLFLAAMSIYSFGTGLCFSALNRVIIETSAEPMGVRVAVSTVFFTGFGALGSAMASLFFNGSIASLAYLISAASIIACLLKVGVE